MWWGLLIAVPMLAGTGIAVGALMWARRKRLAGRRSPLTQGLLRGPGHKLRLELDDAQTDMWSWLLAAMFFPAMLFALYIPAAQRPDAGLQTALTFLIAALAVVGLAAFMLVRLVRRVMNLRLGLEAELASGQELDQLMRRGAFVFHDLPCKDFNIDHVLVCSAGVFAVETKSRMKTIGSKGVEYRLNFDGSALNFPGWTETKPIEQARRQASWLAGDLTRATGEEVRVTPVLAFPGWFIERTGRSDVWVVNPKDFTYLLEARRDPLSVEQMKRISYQLEQRCRDIAPAYTSRQ
jgi:hypothetical protein